MTGATENSRRPRERGKRWLRIHVTGTQSHDLFYPCSQPLGGGQREPTIEFVGIHRPPTEMFINGELTELREVHFDNSMATARIARADLVLPGENVVSLPVSCDPRAIRLVGDGGRPLGWGSQVSTHSPLSDRHLDASVGFLLRSLSRDPFGIGVSSLTAWDQRESCVRLWSWYWTTAIVYEALAGLVDAGELAIELRDLEDGFLGRQVTEAGETRGGYFVRWDPDRNSQGGVKAWYAPNDAAFIGLHGLLAAHRRTGQGVWLDRAILLADWIRERGMLNGRLRVGWNAVDSRWDDSWHYIDGAWTPAFFLELATRSGDARYAECAEVLVRDTIDRFATDGPFYLKIWRASGRHTRTVFTRGMAWVLEGWLPMVAAGHDWLLPRVRELVRGLLDHQRPDGSWPYLLDRPDSGPCNKGTPAIAFHLQRARAMLPELDDRIGAAVALALSWCEQQMDLRDGSPSHGGIFAHNEEGAITTVRDIPVAFNYASAYYILARREQVR
jgi:rhamnogalacturonyl hydrolase YesR